MSYKKYILETYTNWCGEENNFLVIAKEEELDSLDDEFDGKAYENFREFNGFNGILEELFDYKDEYTEEEELEAMEIEHDYYGHTIREIEKDEDEEWFELFIDTRKRKN